MVIVGLHPLIYGWLINYFLAPEVYTRHLKTVKQAALFESSEFTRRIPLFRAGWLAPFLSSADTSIPWYLTAIPPYKKIRIDPLKRKKKGWKGCSGVLGVWFVGVSFLFFYCFWCLGGVVLICPCMPLKINPAGLWCESRAPLPSSYSIALNRLLWLSPLLLCSSFCFIVSLAVVCLKGFK